MSGQPSSSQQPVLTDYAKKYGRPPPGKLPDLPPHKSGLTPLLQLHPNLTRIQFQDHKAISKYQRGRIAGFTSRDLLDIDSITTRTIVTDGLPDVPIHPILDKRRWETNTPFNKGKRELEPLFGDAKTYGNWVAGNPRIWPRFEPVLKVCSLLLGMVHKHPWFETVMSGDVKDVDEERFSADDRLKEKNGVRGLVEKYKKITAKADQGQNQWAGWLGKNQKESLTNMIFLKDVYFGFAHHKKRPLSGTSSQRTFEGLTQPLGCGKIHVWLSHQNVAVLLRDDLSSSERLAEQFVIANTLFHELMHAFFHARHNYVDGKRTSPHTEEYYFEDEQLREMGFSAENALFGGLLWPLKQNPDEEEHVHLGHFFTSWPSFKNYQTPQLIEPAMSDWVMAMPIPITYIENLFSQDYWDQNVKKYGLRMLKPPEPALVSSQKKPMRIDGFSQINPLRTPIEEMTHLKKQLHADLREATPAERKAHGLAMKVETAKKRVKLLRRRQSWVNKVIDTADLYIIESKESDAKKLDTNLLNLIRCHESAIALLPEYQKEDDRIFREALEDLVHFTKSLAAFLTRYIDDDLFKDKAAKFRSQVAKTLENLNLLAADGLTCPESLIGQYSMQKEEQNKIRDQAEVAFKNGDFNRCQELCQSLGASIVCAPETQVVARTLLGAIKSIPIEQRIFQLRRAVKIYAGLKGEIHEADRDDFNEWHEKAKSLLEEAEKEQDDELEKKFKGMNAVEIDEMVDMEQGCQKGRKHQMEEEEDSNTETKKPDDGSRPGPVKRQKGTNPDSDTIDDSMDTNP